MINKLLKNKSAHYWFIGSFFLGLTILLHWDVVRSPSAIVLAGSSLGGYFSWLFWWWSYALSHHLPLFHCPFVMFPTGASMFLHSPINEIPAVLMQTFLSPYAVTNFLTIAGYPLAGFAAYCLNFKLTRNTWASLCGAMAYAFGSYMIVQHRFGHINEATIFLNPLFVLAAAAYVEARTMRNAVIFMSSFLGLCLVGPYMTVGFGVLFLTGAFIYSLPGRQWREYVNQRSLKHLSLFLIPCFFFILIYWPILRHAGKWEGGKYRIYTTLASLVSPPFWHRFDFIRNLSPMQNPVLGEESMAYLGLLTFLLLGYAFIRGFLPKKPLFRFWFWILFWSGILSFGSWLRVTPQNPTPIPLPYILFENLPIFSGLRTVSRFWVTTSLAASVLVALGFHELTRRRNAIFRCVLALSFLGFWFWEFDLGQIGKWYFSTQPLEAYHIIKNDPDQFAILELPQGHDESFDFGAGAYTYMFFQPFHQRPMVLGNLSRYLKQNLDFTEKTPFLFELTHPWILKKLENEPHLKEKADWLRRHGRQQLQAANIKYVILHTNLEVFQGQHYAPTLKKWIDDILGPAYHSDRGKHFLYKVYDGKPDKLQ